MAKKYDESEGVWRTIGGRRVFIRTGQSLGDAMRESGKFKNLKGNTEYEKRKEDVFENLEQYEVYDRADALAYRTSDMELRKDILKRLDRIDRANRNAGNAQKPTEELKDILRENSNVNTLTEKDLKGVKTQKSLKDLVDNYKAEDITLLSNEETKALGEKEGRLEAVKVTKGVYGMNGALLKSKRTGKHYVITARNTNLFYWV